MEIDEARRCVRAIADYLRKGDGSPKASHDLETAVRVIVRHETAELRERIRKLEDL